MNKLSTAKRLPLEFILEQRKEDWKRKMLGQLWSRIKDIVFIFVVVLYIVFGAYVFRVLELDESSINKTMHARMERMSYCAEKVCDQFDLSLNCSVPVEKVLWNSTACPKEAEQQTWSLGEAAIFAGTLITTIGYGNLAPVTVGGRVFTMFYAIVGIPLMLLMLARLGYLFSVCFVHCWIRVRHIFFGYTPAVEEKFVELAAEQQDFPLSLAFLITIGWIFACAAVFYWWEGWDYFTCVYFTFVTLTTIGLGMLSVNIGDVMPSSASGMLVSCGMVIIGLSLISMSLSLMERKIQDVFESIMVQIEQVSLEDKDSDELNDYDASGLIEEMIRQEGGTQVMSFVMGESRKSILTSEWLKRASQKVKGTQTEHRSVDAGVQCVLLVDEESFENTPNRTRRNDVPLLEIRPARGKQNFDKNNMDGMKQLLHDLNDVLSDCRILATCPTSPSTDLSTHTSNVEFA